MSLFVFAETHYVHFGYSVKCAKCVESSKDTCHLPGIAWRSTEPYKKKDGKVFACYKCEYGHKYWAELR